MSNIFRIHLASSDVPRGGAQPVYWDPQASSSIFSFSNNNLTLTASGAGNGTSVANVGPSNGQWYWEEKETDSGGNTVLYGICNVSYSLGNLLGASDTHSVGLERQGGAAILYNGSSIGNLANNSGDVIGIAMDRTDNTIEFFNVTQSTNSGLISLSALNADDPNSPWFAAVSINSNPATVVGNFGVGGFVGSLPPGYLPYYESSGSTSAAALNFHDVVPYPTG